MALNCNFFASTKCMLELCLKLSRDRGENEVHRGSCSTRLGVTQSSSAYLLSARGKRPEVKVQGREGGSVCLGYTPSKRTWFLKVLLGTAKYATCMDIEAALENMGCLLWVLDPDVLTVKILLLHCSLGLESFLNVQPFYVSRRCVFSIWHAQWYT